MNLPRTRLAALGAALLGLVLVAGVFVWAGADGPAPSPSPDASPTSSPTRSPSPPPTPSPSPTPRPAACPYNGLPLEDPSVLDRATFLVQVENHPLGRPTSGLNSADLVVEAPVEGDTTRFGPVYLCRDAPAAIGPIRSARYYNTDLWRQLRLITAHYGAGGAILTQFARTNTPFVNGLDGGWPFFVRRSTPAAPHNVYFDLALARRMAAESGLGGRVERAGSPRSSFSFDPGATIPQGTPVRSVTIFTASFWSFGWEWDAERKRWLRFDAGAPHVDALSGERLNARSVVVQYVEQTILPNEPDPGGYPRRRQHLVGSGRGILYAEGRAVPLRWERASDGDVTTFTYAETGDRMVLHPGRVWWEIIPAGSSVTNR